MKNSITPEELRNTVGSLVEKLKNEGAAEAAEILTVQQLSAFTSSSEWLGELGLAVRQFRLPIVFLAK